MLENANTFPGIPGRHHIYKARGDSGGVEDASVEKDRIRTPGLGVRLEKCRHVTRNCRILCVRKSEFLQGHAGRTSRHFIRSAMWEEAVENDLLHFFRTEVGG